MIQCFSFELFDSLLVCKITLLGIPGSKWDYLLHENLGIRIVEVNGNFIHFGRSIKLELAPEH